MPQVGRKHFPYTSTGRAAAKKYAKSTGQKMKKTKKKGGY
jgi:hypothetical protein